MRLLYLTTASLFSVSMAKQCIDCSGSLTGKRFSELSGCCPDSLKHRAFERNGGKLGKELSAVAQNHTTDGLARSSRACQVNVGTHMSEWQDSTNGVIWVKAYGGHSSGYDRPHALQYTNNWSGWSKSGSWNIVRDFPPLEEPGFKFDVESNDFCTWEHGMPYAGIIVYCGYFEKVNLDINYC
ncbi:hypothetical protein EMPS_10581 [Entomortierella parvispora]|uniref:Uncharacterized protein n=1 Tax=Entomortierella parvispora TaxID=205924 RepID=A0A9P3HKA3_9FUNG|nr:hypothetical protein EMPS_10581 [Entomortierella parvispora]